MLPFEEHFDGVEAVLVVGQHLGYIVCQFSTDFVGESEKEGGALDVCECWDGLGDVESGQLQLYPF